MTFRSVVCCFIPAGGSSCLLASPTFLPRAQALQFLDLLQLRVLFTLLVGALAGIASICIDLSELFRGSFSITASTAQLRVLQRVVDEELTSSCE